MLTDGSVGNNEEIVNFIEQNCKDQDSTKLFTFGIGSGCSRDFINRAAKVGKGEAYFVSEDSLNELKPKVIEAL